MKYTYKRSIDKTEKHTRKKHIEKANTIIEKKVRDIQKQKRQQNRREKLRI